MNKGNVKHVFPGGNTSKGFYSYYDYILSQDEAKRIIVIKGGPGVGKSSFMKRIGEEFIDRGYDIEHMHCSSDNDSLDGIVIPKIKIALMDGTAPHVVDPKNPGCVDEIIHLGEYWNEEGIRKYRNEITETNREVGKMFNRAYKYLNSAKNVYDDIETIYNDATDYGTINMETAKLIEKVFAGLNKGKTIGKTRKLFASAITPEGLKNHIDSIINVKNLYIIKGEPGTGKSTLLEKISEYAKECGLYCENYYCSLDPEKIEHILIPQLETALTTSNEYHTTYISNYNDVIDLNDYVNTNKLAPYESILAFDRKMFNELLDRAISSIKNAKSLHDLMETYYIPNMNFEEVDKKRNQVMERILVYASES